MSSSLSLGELQSRWQFPVEGYFLPGPNGTYRWIFVTEDGDFYENQQDSRFALMAVLNGNRYCFSENPGDLAMGLEHLTKKNHLEDHIQLVRITGQGEFQTLLSCQNPPVAKNHLGAVLFLMDFGKVLCDFDYALFASSFEKAFSKPPTAEGLRLAEKLRRPFEAGEFGPNEFFEAVRKPFHLEPTEQPKFALTWCGFLRFNPSMVTLVRHFLQQPQTQLRMVSNVDPWVVEHASRVLGLKDLFEDGVFSFLNQVNPKDVDASMWKLARQRGLQGRASEDVLVIATDDTASHLERVQLENAADLCICFQNPAKWLFELSRHGIRLPMS